MEEKTRIQLATTAELMNVGMMYVSGEIFMHTKGTKFVSHLPTCGSIFGQVFSELELRGHSHQDIVNEVHLRNLRNI